MGDMTTIETLIKEKDAFVTRATVPGIDAILGYPYAVLDDGFVRVIDYMGNDAAIVQAARISYGAGTKTSQDDRGLIRYLMRMRHTSPFEQAEIKLHVRVPMDTWRQWVRHRSASLNEYSTRYSEAIDSMQGTDDHYWRTQASNNKQGSAGFLPSDVGALLSKEERDLQAYASNVYKRRLEAGVAREQARKDLPLSTYTEAYWKIDLHNLLHFLKLRLDPHAQLEIRTYAEVIATVVKQWCPLTWEAFEDYSLNSIQLSGPEIAHINGAAEGLGKRELEELEVKLKRLGLKE